MNRRRLVAGFAAVALVGVIGLVPIPWAWSGPPSGPAVNPVAGSQGFLVFVQGNAALNANGSQGAVALGGNLSLSQTDLALGKTIVGSTAATGLVANRADDGDTATYWQSATGAFPQTLTVDLGSSQNVSQVVLRLPAAFTARSQTLSVLLATTASSFTTAVASTTYPFNPATGNAVTIAFSATSARYVRLSITANSVLAAGQVAEFEVRRSNSGQGNTFNVASTSAGTFTASGDARPTGLLIGGHIDWANSGPNADVVVGQSSYAKLGDASGTSVSLSSGADTHLVVAAAAYGSLPRVSVSQPQSSASVTQGGLINFAAAFATFSARSTDFAACDNTVVLRGSGGTALPATIPPGTNAVATLTAGTQNVLNITAANLANIGTLTFANRPNASTPLLINVYTGGVGDDLTWAPPSANGLNDPDAGFILWNFATASRLTLTGSTPLRGTVYAPLAGLYDTESPACTEA